MQAAFCWHAEQQGTSCCFSIFIQSVPRKYLYYQASLSLDKKGSENLCVKLHEILVSVKAMSEISLISQKRYVKWKQNIFHRV